MHVIFAVTSSTTYLIPNGFSITIFSHIYITSLKTSRRTLLSSSRVTRFHFSIIKRFLKTYGHQLHTNSQKPYCDSMKMPKGFDVLVSDANIHNQLSTWTTTLSRPGDNRSDLIGKLHNSSKGTEYTVITWWTALLRNIAIACGVGLRYSLLIFASDACAEWRKEWAECTEPFCRTFPVKFSTN